MSKSINEVIFKFIFSFVLLNVAGYFIDFLEMGLKKSFFIALGMGTVDLIVFLIKKKTAANKL